MKRFLLGLSLLGMSWAQSQCYLQARPFLKVETGVSGGIAFHRDSVLLVIPDDNGGAAVWLEEHGQVHKGVLKDYQALAAEVASVYELKAYEPSMDHLDPYALRSSIHAHDGTHCFSYSPQRDCSVRGDRQAPPSEAELSRFREILGRIRQVEKLATTPATAEQFQAAEQVLWKS